MGLRACTRQIQKLVRGNSPLVFTLFFNAYGLHWDVWLFFLLSVSLFLRIFFIHCFRLAAQQKEQKPFVNQHQDGQVSLSTRETYSNFFSFREDRDLGFCTKPREKQVYSIIYLKTELSIWSKQPTWDETRGLWLQLLIKWWISNLRKWLMGKRIDKSMFFNICTFLIICIWFLKNEKRSVTNIENKQDIYAGNNFNI